MGVEVLKFNQYGLESVHGTHVAADTKLGVTMGLPSSDREQVIPQMELGVRMANYLDAAYCKRVLADGISLECNAGAYFEILPLIFSLGLRGGISPSAGGSGDYTWEFAVNQTGTVDVDTATFECSDDVQAYEVGHVFAKTINMSGVSDEGDVTLRSDLCGDKVTQTTATGAISLPTVNMMVGKKSRVYVDSSWANLGNTELANGLVSWELNIDTGVHEKLWGSAQMELDDHQQGFVGGSLVMTFERNSALASEELNYRPTSTYSGTTRFVRLVNTGPLIGGGAYHTLTVDMAGQWQDWGAMGTSKNGNTLDVATLTFGYDATGAQGLRVEVVTGVSGI